MKLDISQWPELCNAFIKNITLQTKQYTATLATAFGGKVYWYFMSVIAKFKKKW